MKVIPQMFNELVVIYLLLSFSFFFFLPAAQTADDVTVFIATCFKFGTVNCSVELFNEQTYGGPFALLGNQMMHLYPRVLVSSQLTLQISSSLFGPLKFQHCNVIMKIVLN